jgi:hypothetical protein
MIGLDELISLLEILRDNRVTHFKTEEVELSLDMLSSPIESHPIVEEKKQERKEPPQSPFDDPDAYSALPSITKF